MLAKQIVLCLCATMAVAIPIKSVESLVEIETVSDSAFTKDIDLAERIPLSQEEHQERMLIPAFSDKMKVFAKDKIKTRIRRDIFRVKCPAGETKIGGICMSCQDMGMC